ncbi:VWA domain-containing protein [Microbacterium indicum]|uniref:VWA domain-containing protein n=1 Tax=Microbacterium indicum TaxID=358100 RepID=UPI0004261768|nr:VWA domain-containing protein [Microbacterium indicum]
MTVQPVIPLALLAVIVLPVLGLAVFELARGPRRLAWALRVVLVLAVGLVALRPGVPDGAARTVATDVDVYVVVDATTSITAEDWGDGQTRLDGVRDDVADLVAAYPGARYALIAFDNDATQRLPLTTDQDALLASIDVMRPPATAYSRGSSIGVAADLLEQTLAAAASDDSGRSRMVFYLGDGEQTTGSEPESFAASAPYVDGGAVFGYGTTQGGPMREVGVTDEADAPYIQYQGSDALSVIDEQALGDVADQLGVGYQHRTADAAADFPEAPSVTTTFGDDETGTRTELTWVAALLVAALLAAELARGAAAIRATRVIAGARRGRATAIGPAPGAGPQDPSASLGDDRP